MDDMFLPGLMIGILITIIIMLIVMFDTPTYNDGYCEAFSSKYIPSVGCIKDDKIIHKFKN